MRRSSERSIYKFRGIKCTCEVCGKEFSYHISKICFNCHKLMCPSCTQYTLPYRPFHPYFSWKFWQDFRFDDYPACPHCYEETEREREEKNAEDRRRHEEIYGDREDSEDYEY